MQCAVRYEHCNDVIMGEMASQITIINQVIDIQYRIVSTSGICIKMIAKIWLNVSHDFTENVQITPICLIMFHHSTFIINHQRGLCFYNIGFWAQRQYGQSFINPSWTEFLKILVTAYVLYIYLQSVGHLCQNPLLQGSMHMILSLSLSKYMYIYIKHKSLVHGEIFHSPHVSIVTLLTWSWTRDEWAVRFWIWCEESNSRLSTISSAKQPKC